MNLLSGRLVRSGLLLVLCSGAVAVISITGPDVDLWGHLKFGQDVLTSGTIRQPDVYSFTSDKVWINHEWLFEVAMAVAYEGLGPAGLILLRWAAVAALCWLVWNNARKDGASTDSAVALITLVALLTFTRTQHVRPQLASVVAFAAALSIVRQAVNTRAISLVALPPLMVIWANAHGGWIVGGGALGLWAATQALWGAHKRLGVLVGLSTAVGLLATICNPYGAQLWTFLASTVGFGRPDISEWAPVTQAGWGILTAWSITALLVARAFALGFLPAPADRVLVVALGIASFRVSRLDTFFVIAAAMLCSKGRFVPGLHLQADAAPTPAVRGRLVGAILGVAIAITLATVGVRRLGCLDMSSAAWLPESPAIDSIRNARLRGRILTYFDWGEYAIWHLSPELKVSMDGRRETVYSDRHIQGHLKVYSDHPGSVGYIREISPDYAWLPKGSPAVKRLRALGWSTVWDGDRSTLLSRAESTPINRSDGRSLRDVRCFPGP